MLYGTDKTKNSNGTIRTKSLFLELCYDDSSAAIFTLKDDDHTYKGKHFASLSKLYVSMVPSDPTEYQFAQAVFGSWNVWDTIKSSPMVNKEYQRWKKEAEIKVKSQAIQAIATEMKEGGRSSFSAAKLLLERGWLEKTTATKAKRAVEEKEMNNEAIRLLGEDAQRLGLKVN